MRFLTPLFFVLVFQLNAQQPETHSVYFDTDAHNLRPDGRAALDKVAARITLLPDYRLSVSAHTDDRGAESYNLGLAERRARSVVAYLAGRGVIVDKVQTASYGESTPLQTNETEEGRQANRRVDLLLTPVQVPSLSDLLQHLYPDEQRYSIDPSQPTRLVGREGTHCWIEGGSLTFADGSTPSGPVEIVLREVYGPGDMLLHGLSTASGGQPLQTGGMVYLSAEADGRPLQLAAGGSILVGMPSGSPAEGMQLFMGRANAGGAVTDWQPTGQPARPSLEDFIDMPPPPGMPVLVLHKQKMELEYPLRPQAPEQPRAPFRPREPAREDARYNPGFVRSLLLGRDKIEAKEEAMYHRMVEQYQRRRERYLRDSVAYVLTLDSYRQQSEDYQAALEQWQQEKQAIDRLRDSLQMEAEAGQRTAYHLKLDAYYEAYRAWKAERLRRVEAYYDNYLPAGEAGARFLKGYLYTVNQLGWINCDRFWQVPEAEKAMLSVRDEDEHEETIFVHFREDQSLLRADRQGEAYVTAGIPRKAEVRIIGIKMKDGRPHLAIRDTRVDAEESYVLEYEPVSLREIRRALSATEG